MRRRDLLVIPAAAVAVMALNIVASFVVVWVYSTFVNPGQPFSRYEAFAAQSAPISSVVCGIPLMFGAGFWLAKGRSRRGALIAAGAVALVYVAVDVMIVMLASLGEITWTWEALSYPTKFLSALTGARIGPGDRAGAVRRA